MTIDGAAAPGGILAGYRIEERLGRGGMGEVYRAHDIALDRPVALKLLTRQLADDERFRERMLRESRLAASLDHPNVIPIYEAGEIDGRLYIAMRYVDGIDLRGLLSREGALGSARAIHLAGQVAEALDAAHERGLVHRDVKASNVLLDGPGTREHCYLADFGLTQSDSESGPTDGQLMGTVGYVAPEQIRGDEVDGRADQYALGCLLFELLTGTLPFAGGSEVATVFAQLQEPPPAASDRRTTLPPAVDAALARALAKEPAYRFPSCRAFVGAVADALGVASPTPVGRRTMLVAAVAVAAIAAAAISAVVLLHRGGGGFPQITGNLVRIDANSGHVAQRVAVPGYPGTLTATPNGVWIADFRLGGLWRFTTRTGSIERIVTSGEPRDLASLGGSVYVASDGPKVFSGTVARYDAATGLREDGIALLACAVASGEGVVWAAGCPFVDRISTGAGAMRVLRRVFLPFASTRTALNDRVQFRALALGGGSLWVLGDPLDRRLWRLDPRTGAIVATIPLRFPPRSLAYADGVIWVTDPLNDTVVPVDARSNTVGLRISVCRGASGVAADRAGVWVACSLDGTVVRIDPKTRRVVKILRLGGRPHEVAIGGDNVWVTAGAA